MKHRQLEIPKVMSFYFKVNNSKFNNLEKLQYQIELVGNRLIKTHNINYVNHKLMFGTMDDDIVLNRCRLCISFY